MDFERLQNFYKDPYGLWDVYVDSYTGRKHIGIFKGNFSDIALYVKSERKVNDPLIFTKIDIEAITVPTNCTGQTHVIMGQDTFWHQFDISSQAMCEEYQKVLKDVSLVSARIIKTGTCIVKREETEEIKRAKALEKAKATLSKEELKLLGLSSDS